MAFVDLSHDEGPVSHIKYSDWRQVDFQKEISGLEFELEQLYKRIRVHGDVNWIWRESFSQINRIECRRLQQKAIDRIGSSSAGPVPDAIQNREWEDQRAQRPLLIPVKKILVKCRFSESWKFPLAAEGESELHREVGKDDKRESRPSLIFNPN